MSETKKTEMRTIVRYKHEDGTAIDVDPNKMSSLITLERELGRSFKPDSTEDQMRLAYMLAGHPNGTSDDDFLEWVDGIEDAEQVQVERPTRRRRSSSAA